ncbi:MAG: Ni,Fe-hydrogenase I large subunit [Deltaproteobacteria bacterium CG2_30_63_29]|nr:MAG: Ni,Fe-hydrogenase I large subunit [Deltaproteobacteria bacterium CG2_30_63_29]PJB36987.1 MAG: Ni,Fe-hydrogenase I large subunit [Deltaproteobacteria bacterium CG_4_9_14_3_um_filter_63_12]
MARKIEIDIPMNRVEGDLEVRVEIEDGRVTQAWCSGTMYRGFEQLLRGRGAKDGLVLTPRICGICTTSHLTAAVLALDEISQVKVPTNALWVRSLVHAVEHVQSDVRQMVLMVAPDLVNPHFSASPSYAEALARYAPLSGTSAIAVIQQTKRVLEIVAILGGQWPHSSFMVPGGIVSNPTSGDLLQCGHQLQEYTRWYERFVLGCSIQRWREVTSLELLEQWLEESPDHRDGELGFFLRYGRELGLHTLGVGCGAYLSAGGLEIPTGDSSARFVRAGFSSDAGLEELDHAYIAEHIEHSWFVGYEGGRHPYAGETTPYATGGEGKKYSWAKAPRYKNTVVETGPLAQRLVAKDPLYESLLEAYGPSALVRQLARLARPATLLPEMMTWLRAIRPDQECYVSPEPIVRGRGCGLTEASRGVLGHWVQIEDGKIDRYQIITPTAWNASPRDSDGKPGPIEQALVGAPVADLDNPVELGLIVRSFDPCLVCTVHAVTRDGAVGHYRLGL